MSDKFVAFLRAVNVGGHNLVKMTDLRRMFESFGLLEVATFIQSGNVIFETPASGSEALERRIQTGLQAKLGFPVEVFLRSMNEVHQLQKQNPYRDDAATSVYVAFLRKPPSRTARQALLDLANPVDDFTVAGREVFCLRHRDRGESLISNAFIEKTLGQPSTLRNITSIRKMAAKFG